MTLQITCVEHPRDAPIPRAALDDPRTKIVHLVRHGEGTHNRHAAAVPPPACACPSGPCAYRNPAHADASLTLLGRRQAAAAGAALAAVPGAAPARAYVSPLTRTLETAAAALAAGPGMACIPVVADERLRERYGVHVCDMRSAKEDVSRKFPAVDFGRIAAGKDPLYRADEREPRNHVAERSKAFFSELRRAPEKCVAVFAHSAFYRETMRAALVTPDPNVARGFKTGEVRCVLLTFSPSNS